MDRKKNISLKQNVSVFPIEQSQLKRKFFFSNLCCDEYRKYCINELWLCHYEVEFFENALFCLGLEGFCQDCPLPII